MWPRCQEILKWGCRMCEAGCRGGRWVRGIVGGVGMCGARGGGGFWEQGRRGGGVVGGRGGGGVGRRGGVMDLEGGGGARRALVAGESPGPAQWGGLAPLMF